MSSAKGKVSKTTSNRPPKQPRKLTLAACQYCRRAKRRCDGQRPSCAQCVKVKVLCQYDTGSSTESHTQALKRRHEDAQVSHELVKNTIDWLRNQNPALALSCLDRIRHVADPLTELCRIATSERAQQLRLDLVPEGYLLNMSYSLNSMLDVELSLSHPASFPILSDIPLSLSEGVWTCLEPPSSPSVNANIPDTEHDTQTTLGHGNERFCDDRLSSLKIRYWTTVAIYDSLAAGLISKFLSVEQPVYGFFDSDLFLQDLVGQKTHFCSALLVNSILFWASCTFRPFFPVAYEVTEAFLKSVQQLLDAEPTAKSELTVAALSILSISSICYGKDALAKRYMTACIQMGKAMRLFGIERSSAEEFGKSPDETRMLSYVAWGAFNLSTVYALHFHDTSPATFPRYPPLLRLPGQEMLNDEPSSSLTHCPVPSYMGTSFAHFCQFWCIVHEITAMYFSSLGPIHEHVTMAFAESKFISLLKWADGLPPECNRHKAMPHYVAEMHICYHATIMDIFRPFVSQHQLLSTFASDPKRPIAIFALSFGHLKDLTRYYHTQFAGTAPSHTISWVHGPLYTASAVLKYEERDMRAANFRYCLQSCAGLLQSHAVMYGMVKALSGMAISAGVLDSRQALDLLEGFAIRSSGKHRKETPDAGFVIDHDTSMEDRNVAVGDVLTRRFDEMVLSELAPSNE